MVVLEKIFGWLAMQHQWDTRVQELSEGQRLFHSADSVSASLLMILEHFLSSDGPKE
jgi:hypothetical protein